MKLIRGKSPSDLGFALGDFAKQCEFILVEQRTVYFYDTHQLGSRWQRICTLAALENCDAAPLLRD